MFTYSYPHFNKGRILKTSMLEGLRDFPRDYIELYYRGYADGILAGAEVEVFPDKLIVSPGMVLHKGRLYMLTEPMELVYQATGRVNVLKLRFTAEETVSDMTISHSELLLDEETTCTSGELELARFKLKKGPGCDGTTRPLPIWQRSSTRCMSFMSLMQPRGQAPYPLLS
ncbi:hypothetical protein [Paenibacillus sp. 1A_MP2]|uniref:hypothetical protein n=1 Tax=Paenibacillus sp. 1A_MP2 TaxID=3457495 RepID=UPI003FCC6CCA